MSDFRTARPQDEGVGDVEFGVADLFDVLAARKWTVLGVALVVMAASIFSSSQESTTYSSKASVLIATAAQSSVGAQQLLATEKQLARSRSVAAIVVHDLQLKDSPDHVLRGLSVSVPLNTQFIEFGYQAASPREAERLAQAFVDAYIKHQAQLLNGLVASSQEMDQYANSLRLQLAKAQATPASGTSVADASAASASVDSLTAEIATLEYRRTTLLASALTASTLAEPASPSVRNAPPVKRGAIVGLIAGLVLGAFAAFALEYALRRRRRREPQAGQPPTRRRWETSGP